MFIPLSEKFISTTRLGRFIGRISGISSIAAAPFIVSVPLLEHQAKKALLEPIAMTVHIPNYHLSEIVAASCKVHNKKWYEFVHLQLQSHGQKVSAPFPCFVEKLKEEVRQGSILTK